MSIEQVKIIDAIGIDKKTDEVILTISNHLICNNKNMFLLQNKLNKYLEFIESGQLINTYPKALNKQVKINVVCAYEPSEILVKFIHNVNNMGINLTYEVLKCENN